MPRSAPALRTPPDPATVLEAQALRLRVRWGEPGQREVARARLTTAFADDPLRSVWSEVLDGAHPFAAWLNGSEPWAACPEVFPEGVTRRVLVTSHPFIAGSPWSIRATSPAS